MNYTLIKKVVAILVFLVVSNCSVFSSFIISYEVKSETGLNTAQIGSKFMNHWIIIKNGSTIIFDEELYFDGIEAGIANFHWNGDKEFAVKLCGYNSWAMIKIFDTFERKVIKIEYQELLTQYTWLNFGLDYSWSDNIEKFSVSDRINSDPENM